MANTKLYSGRGETLEEATKIMYRNAEDAGDLKGKVKTQICLSGPGVQSSGIGVADTNYAKAFNSALKSSGIELQQYIENRSQYRIEVIALGNFKTSGESTVEKKTEKKKEKVKPSGCSPRMPRTGEITDRIKS